MSGPNLWVNIFAATLSTPYLDPLAVWISASHRGQLAPAMNIRTILSTSFSESWTSYSNTDIIVFWGICIVNSRFGTGDFRSLRQAAKDNMHLCNHRDNPLKNRAWTFSPPGHRPPTVTNAADLSTLSFVSWTSILILILKYFREFALQTPESGISRQSSQHRT